MAPSVLPTHSEKVIISSIMQRQAASRASTAKTSRSERLTQAGMAA